jgi:hypothetical protein
MEDSHYDMKEMKEMNPYLLGVVTKYIGVGSSTQISIFNHTIECTQTLLEFYIYAPYKSHDDAILSYLQHA